MVIRMDEMGSLSARSYLGREPVRSFPGKAERTKQELDRNRRMGGYVFGAFRLTTGGAQTAAYESRSIATFADFDVVFPKVGEQVKKGELPSRGPGVSETDLPEMRR